MIYFDIDANTITGNKIDENCDIDIEVIAGVDTKTIPDDNIIPDVNVILAFIIQ